jgi:hypothetical protein
MLGALPIYEISPGVVDLCVSVGLSTLQKCQASTAQHECSLGDQAAVVEGKSPYLFPSPATGRPYTTITLESYVAVRRQGYPQTSARTCVTRLQVSWCRPGEACVRCRRAPVAIAAGGRRQWVARSQLPRANTRSTVDADMASRIEQLRTSVPMRRIAAVVGRSVATLSRVSSGRMLRPSSRVISTRPCNPSYRSGCRCAEGWRRRS